MLEKIKMNVNATDSPLNKKKVAKLSVWCGKWENLVFGHMISVRLVQYLQLFC